MPIKACDEIALCVLNLRRHWQLCLLCVYSSQSDSPSFILQFWLKTHWEGKKHRQVFLTFTTTKSGFGNDSKKSLCKFMVGKNLRLLLNSGLYVKDIWWGFTSTFSGLILKSQYFISSFMKVYLSTYICIILFFYTFYWKKYMLKKKLLDHTLVSFRAGSVGHVMPI